jgi:restriction system protein
MIVRNQWLYRRYPQQARLVNLPKGASLSGWATIASLTFLLALWLGYRAFYQPDWLADLPAVLDEVLALIEAAGAFTLGFLWFTLVWRQWRQAAPLPALDVADLYKLSPGDFEKYVAYLFRCKGYRVRVRGRSGDDGVDLEVVQPGGKRAVVQCKRYQHTVGPDIVRELYGTLIHERAAHAFLVTTAHISGAARQWARHKPITLIDGPTLAQIAAALQGQIQK